MSADSSKSDQVVFECMQKIAEVIISSRVSLHQHNDHHQRHAREVNTKFSLHLEELEFVRHSMEAWKADLHMPLGIDVFWQEHRRGDSAPSVELLERWEIMYETQDAAESKSAQLRHLYKRAIILLRTLYTFVRMVPAYQVHRRIQKAYDDRDKDQTQGNARDDMGFCLYPVLDRGNGGSGLEFCSDSDNGSGSGAVYIGEAEAETTCYSFKPLEAPHGEIRMKVTYLRRGVGSKGKQDQMITPGSSFAPNMTTSIIQDYVPDQYEKNQPRHNGGDFTAPRTLTVEGEIADYWPKLATMPEDAAAERGLTRNIGGSGEKERMNTHGDELDEVGELEKIKSSARAIQQAHAPFRKLLQRGDDAQNIDEADIEVGRDVMYWPSPEQGHGYTHKRIHKPITQGLAPFLTPGPHRHKLVPGGRERHDFHMEPLDLGPNANIGAEDHQPPAVSMFKSFGHGEPPEENEHKKHGYRSSINSNCGAHSESRSLDAHDEYGLEAGKLSPSLQHQFQQKETQMPIGHRRDTPQGHRVLVAQAVGGVGRPGAVLPAVYRRNSISEAPMVSMLAATHVPHEQLSLSLNCTHTTRGHWRGSSALTLQESIESTPPFSYYEKLGSVQSPGVESDTSPLRVGQPLVTFSPPFGAIPLDLYAHAHNYGNNNVFEQEDGTASGSSPLRSAKAHHNSELQRMGPRISAAVLAASGSPSLLETLPESPFSLKVETRPQPGAQYPIVADTVDRADGARLYRDERRIDAKAERKHQIDIAKGRGTTFDALPFAADMRSEGVGELTEEAMSMSINTKNVVEADGESNVAFFALCSAAASKSEMLMQGSPSSHNIGQPFAFSPEYGGDAVLAHWDRATPASAYTSPEMYMVEEAKTVRSLEEELDGFRQFHQELKGQRS